MEIVSGLVPILHLVLCPTFKMSVELYPRISLSKVERLMELAWLPTILYSSWSTEIGKQAGLFAKLQPGRARKRINAT